MASRTELSPRLKGLVSERLVGCLYWICGYELIAFNWRILGGELDLIARQGHRMVIVEVRARKWFSMLAPRDSLTPRKLRILKSAIRHYQGRYGDGDLEWRFDVATVRWWGLCPFIAIERDVRL